MNTPRRINDGVMMCKPLVLSTGEWVLPTSLWRTKDNSAQMMVSTDHGKNWNVRGACNIPQKDRQFDEHMMIERKMVHFGYWLEPIMGLERVFLLIEERRGPN